MTRAVVGRFVLSLAIIGFTHAQLWGQQAQVTRETLVAAAERGPGPTKGREDAPITMVEFSDFQCSFCRKFWEETLPKIEAEYINTGRVRFVYRHLTALGPFSERAAEAAECAREQGKFWPYHDRLFGRAARPPFADGRLKEYARELRLDPAAFDACLGSGRHKERILGEFGLAAQLGATGTPTFLINGKLLIGAHPFETFKRVLDAMLAGAAGKSPSTPALPGSGTAPARP
jgi:protein-disulfide isomerase